MWRIRSTEIGLCMLAFVCACTPIRGEDRKPASKDAGEDDGKSHGSSAASGGGGGSSAGSAGNGMGASATSGGAGGASAASGQNSMATSAAQGGSGGNGVSAAGNPGPGPSGMPGAPSAAMSNDVTGIVMDYFRQPIEAVQVTIGMTTVMTDQAGAFRIPNVPATYDATLLINSTQNGQPMRFVWRYEGLTRRDPYLQAYLGRTPRGAWLDVRIANVDFMHLEAGDAIQSSYGSMLGEHSAEPSHAAQERIRILWDGPRATTFTGHALRMLKPADQIEGEFYAYSSMKFDITEDQEVRVDYDLKQGILKSGAVYGHIMGAMGSKREIVAYLRFADHAIFEIVREATESESFNYFFPSMADATVIMVVEQHGDGNQVVHADDLTWETEGVDLVLPRSARLVAPAQGQMVNTSTAFQWSSEAKLFLFVASDDSGRDSVYVVTSKREAHLPLAMNFAYTANHKFSWRVETHGEYASPDDAAGPDGFLDTCANYRPRGPTRGKGTFTESEYRQASFIP